MRNEQSHRRLWDCGKGLTVGESLHVVVSYTTTASDRTRGTTRLVLSANKNKSLDLTIMGSINTPITTITTTKHMKIVGVHFGQKVFGAVAATFL